MAAEIVKAQPSKDKDFTEIICWVRWKERADGTLPVVSQVSNNIIKIHDPQLLIKFYESKLLFSSPPQGNFMIISLFFLKYQNINMYFYDNSVDF